MLRCMCVCASAYEMYKVVLACNKWTIYGNENANGEQHLLFVHISSACTLFTWQIQNIYIYIYIYIYIVVSKEVSEEGG
jgi:hypothetical protein